MDMKFILKLQHFYGLPIAILLNINICVANNFLTYGDNSSQNLQVHDVVGRDGNTMLFLTEPWPITDFEKTGYLDGAISKQCMKHLLTFSAVTSRFISCAVTNSRPLRYCKFCVSEYVSVQNAFQLISGNSGDPKNNCREQILRADTILLSFRMHQFVQSIWEASMCYNCFDSPVVNTSQPSTLTATLLHKINVTLECFKDFSFLSHNGSDHNNTVCRRCKTLYCDADDYYKMVERKGKLCSDLVDSMNYTRLAWAERYHCTIALPDSGVIWVITALVFALPFLLYFGVVFYDKRYIARRRGFEDSYCQDLDGSD